ncbi:putative ATPase/DNA-binding CsgD family transcriptional regulator [Hamadaea flava]|uniref:ATP-binding protein n=1 Tax=Hamadaea flava TaxID=1742688 RepID=A0ABV8LSV9_9ACTN|nr:LuxR C-terminal-related transcriptional regulator [Hamadaea flava]MCP2327055.1 putative ATPase/DNA-binding CsgD family transcriptional regulator [Hamadaea flava]
MTAVQAGISTREAEVLALLGEHLSNAEIAARLFISVRTVETHVSSMLRKLDAPDRRALAQLAVEWGRAARGGDVTLGLPAPVTSFVGRAQERAALAAAVTTHRQVSAVGPGGVGKTRLALAVAGDVAPEFPDGVWFVDLVPITDAAMVGATVAAAVGVGEQQGRGIDDTVISALADRRALLVLDNCEQVRDGVAPFLERLLAGAPKLTVLATSRARLMVPFERVHPIPPMSLTGDDDSDAVALFLDRAAAVGSPVAAEQREQVAEICRGLDGVALAIELAAARLPMLGLDGLSGVLADQLRVLTGGARADDRHRSVRAMLDWSVALLDPADRTLLHRIAVFVAPFTVDAAAQVGGATMDGLARLTEQSLLSATPAPGGMRYRTLATIRQYGLEQLAASGELDGVRAEQLRWCLAIAAGLAQDPKPGAGPWRARFDDVADDMRAVLGWAVTAADHRADAYALAVALANLAFTRNLIGEAQQRYEQAAALTDDPYAAGAALRQAAAVAGCRMRGDDMYRLYYAAAETARSVGDDAGTARDLATAAATVYRFSGTFAELPPAGEAAALLAEAQELAGDDPAASAAVALAECGVFSDTAEADLPEAVKRAERAVDLARTSGDPLAHSAALDALAAVQCWAGDTFATAASSRQRVDLLAKVPATPAAALERTNALSEAAESSVGVGDLAAARRWGEQLRDLPLLAERGDFATSRLLLADALAGNAEGVLAACGRFRDAWGLSGGLHTPTLATAAAAVAMIHGLRGDETARAEWLGVVDELDVAPELKAGYNAVFDAIVLLHEGRADEAFALLATEPDEMSEWAIWVWRHWYLAVRAEAAALSGQPDARDQIAAARPIVAGNSIASAHLDRAEALLDNDSSRVLAAAAAFEAAGSRYQRARTLVLAGGDHAKQGVAALADLGLAPSTP